MILTAALVVLATAQQDETLVMAGLRYLARHQGKNGAWGRRLPGCTCPTGIPTRAAEPDAAARDRIAGLIRALDDDDYDLRLEAQKKVAAEGAAAAAPLLEASRKGNPEVRLRALAALAEVECRESADDLETTAMALIAFLGSGFIPLSKDVHDGRNFGEVVKGGLRWLIDRQRPEGSFGGSAAADAWAALALSEAYGITGSNLYRDPAQIAIDCIASHRAADARGLFYQIMALKSGEVSSLGLPRDALVRVTKALAVKRAEEPFSIFTRAAFQIAQIFAHKSRQLLDLTGLPGMHPSLMDLETFYVVDLAIFQADGPHGDHWKDWARARPWLVEIQQTRKERCDYGSWEAAGIRERLRVSALGTMIGQVIVRR
jgi:hypothetical protein